TMTCKAPIVMMEALDKIEFKCGASSMTLTPESLEFKSTNFDLSKASHIEVITGTIGHN
ncbi:MAG: hypothetical protein JRI68_34910, partial [Deltaproteobacteria bacterium]|nr:hypothetical protein [Deltaproteobacteria bacterium]